MAWLHGFMEWAALVALCLGATLAFWLLEACITVCRKLSRKSSDPAFLGGLLFLFLMLGVPAMTVGWGYATGALPYRP